MARVLVCTSVPFSSEQTHYLWSLVWM